MFSGVLLNVVMWTVGHNLLLTYSLQLMMHDFCLLFNVYNKDINRKFHNFLLFAYFHITIK